MPKIKPYTRSPDQSKGKKGTSRKGVTSKQLKLSVSASAHDKSKYCSMSDLRNESDVEQSFIRPLLEELGFNAAYIETKSTIPEKNIGKKSKARPYRPDFICYADKANTHPVLIIDAKNPNSYAEDGVHDAQLYTAVLRRGLKAPKPEQFCMGSNGV